MSTHLLGSEAPTLEQSSVLSWPPMGISRVSSHICSQFPIQLSQAGGGLAGSPAPSGSAANLAGGGQVGEVPGRGRLSGHRLGGVAPPGPSLGENKGFSPTAHKVSVASLWELDLSVKKDSSTHLQGRTRATVVTFRHCVNLSRDPDTSHLFVVQKLPEACCGGGVPGEWLELSGQCQSGMRARRVGGR